MRASQIRKERGKADRMVMMEGKEEIDSSLTKQISPTRPINTARFCMWILAELHADDCPRDPERATLVLLLHCHSPCHRQSSRGWLWPGTASSGLKTQIFHLFLFPLPLLLLESWFHHLSFSSQQPLLSLSPGDLCPSLFLVPLFPQNASLLTPLRA